MFSVILKFMIFPVKKIVAKSVFVLLIPFKKKVLPELKQTFNCVQSTKRICFQEDAPAKLANQTLTALRKSNAPEREGPPPKDFVVKIKIIIKHYTHLC